MTSGARNPTRGGAATAALLLHPVRMRIVQAVTGRTLTTRGLAAALPDVPPATLYRQLTKLVDGGVLHVVATRRMRGAVERTYALPAPVRLSAEEVAGLGREEQARLFQAFVAGLLADHRRYLARDDCDPVRDGVRFRQTTLALTDAEAQQLLAQLEAVVGSAARAAARRAAQDPPAVRRRLVTLITMPADRGDGAAEDDRPPDEDPEAARPMVVRIGQHRPPDP